MTIKMMNKEENAENATYKDEEIRVQIFVKQMLVARVFAASYIGRFYVESLNSYRDALKMYEEECELIKDLQVVRRRIRDFYGETVWAAITDPADLLSTPSGHFIWVRLENVAFGFYWFLIEDVGFFDGGELIIKVKAIRSFEPVTKRKPRNERTTDINEIKNSILHTLQDVITWHNIKESGKFLFLLVVTIITTVLYGLQYLGDYSIRLFREFNNLIKVCTPVFLRTLDLISRAIGGFYILIAMMWRGRAQQQLPPSFPSIQAPPQPLRAIKPLYNRRHVNY